MSFASGIKNVLLGTAISVALYASGFLVIFTPLPLLYVFINRGRKAALLSSLLAIFAVSIFYGIGFEGLSATFGGQGSATVPQLSGGLASVIAPGVLSYIGVGYFFFFAVIAYSLGEGVLRKWGLVKLGGVSFMVALVVFVALAVGADLMMPSGTLGSLKNYLSLMLSQAASLNQNNPNVDVAFVKDHAGEIISYMLNIAPALIFVSTLLSVVANLLISRRLIRGKRAFHHIHNVARFRLPDYLVWAVIAAGSMFFADTYMLHSKVLEIVAVNCLICLGTLYFFQGLAVVAYFLQGIRTPFIKMMAYLSIVLFFQSIGIAIVVLGVADVWADFRLKSWKAKHTHT